MTQSGRWSWGFARSPRCVRGPGPGRGQRDLRRLRGSGEQLSGLSDSGARRGLLVPATRRELLRRPGPLRLPGWPRTVWCPPRQYDQLPV